MTTPDTQSASARGGACGCVGVAAVLLTLAFLGNVAYSCVRYGRQPIECSSFSGVCAGYLGDQLCPLESGLFGYRTQWR